MREKQNIEFILSDEEADNLIRAIRLTNSTSLPDPDLTRIAKAIEDRPEAHLITISISRPKNA